KGPLCERPVTNFSPSSAAQKLNFTNGKRWEAIVQHEELLGLALERPQPLLVIGRAQCGCDQCLRFAAREDCRPMRAWQHSHLNPDVANLIKRARIRTPPLLGHLLAENPLAQHLVIVLEFLARILVVL